MTQEEAKLETLGGGIKTGNRWWRNQSVEHCRWDCLANSQIMRLSSQRCLVIADKLTGFLNDLYFLGRKAILASMQPYKC